MCATHFDDKFKWIVFLVNPVRCFCTPYLWIYVSAYSFAIISKTGILFIKHFIVGSCKLLQYFSVPCFRNTESLLLTYTHIKSIRTVLNWNCFRAECIYNSVFQILPMSARYLTWDTVQICAGELVCASNNKIFKTFYHLLPLTSLHTCTIITTTTAVIHTTLHLHTRREISEKA